jgi:hypothetical protein
MHTLTTVCLSKCIGTPMHILLKDSHMQYEPFIPIEWLYQAQIPKNFNRQSWCHTNRSSFATLVKPEGLTEDEAMHTFRNNFCTPAPGHIGIQYVPWYRITVTWAYNCIRIQFVPHHLGMSRYNMYRITWAYTDTWAYPDTICTASLLQL